MKFNLVTLQEPRLTFAIFFIISVGSLSVALLAEHVFGIAPCLLCIYQRFPYLLVAFISSLGITTEYSQAITLKFLKWLLIVFTCAIVLSGYHVTVEHGWLEPICLSPSIISESMSPEDAWKAIEQTPLADCRHPNFHVLGLSMAEWNLCANIILLASTFWLIRRERTKMRIE